MAWNQEKQENIDQNNLINEIPQNLTDSIFLLEEKLWKLEKGEFLAKQVLLNQINQLKGLEKKIL